MINNHDDVIFREIEIRRKTEREKWKKILPFTC